MNLILSSGIWIGISIFAVLVVIIALFFGIVPVRTWTKAAFSGAYISPSKLAGMKIRNVDVRLIVKC